METRVTAPATTPPAGEHHGGARKQSMFEPAILKRAVGDAIRKLNPRQMWRNPVMFVVEVGSVLTTVLFFRDLGSATAANSGTTGRSRSSTSVACNTRARKPASAAAEATRAPKASRTNAWGKRGVPSRLMSLSQRAAS